MKFKNIILLLLCITGLNASAQLNQRYDNLKYKALYLNDASKLIETTPGLFVLDVRSPGEYADTSRYITNNIGRLKGAKNISIDSIPAHLKELKKYKNTPILVYCSHSVRSRAVSKFLTDSGFTKVYSLNGGMSLVDKSTDKEFPVKAKLYTSARPYHLIESAEALRFIADKNNLVIDVRPKTEFDGRDTTENNNIGRIKNAVNIPADEIEGKMAGLAWYKNRPIVFCDLYWNTSASVAKKFTDAGFKKVYVLFEGLGTLIPLTASNNRTAIFAAMPKYKAVGSKEAISLVKKDPALVVADIRPKDEFENKAHESYQNLGHVANAVNYTVPGLFRYLQNKPKTTPVLIYGSNMTGMQHGVSAAQVSKQLSDKGFTNVYLMYNGMYSLMWSVTNVADCKDGWSILVDHKGLY